MTTISTIRSGGQSGADRGALDAARALGLPVCGWCPKGGWAEDLPEPPGVRALYPELVEAPLADPIQRTEWNVRDSDATLIVCPCAIEGSPGTFATREFAHTLGRPCLVVGGSSTADVEEVVRWLEGLRDVSGQGDIDLNVAGPRESGCPGVYAAAKTLVIQVLEASKANERDTLTA